MSDWTDAEDKLAHELNFRGFEMTQDGYEVGSLENAEKFAIIRMAREAGFDVDEGLFPFEATEDKFIGTERHLERFAALVRAETIKAYRKGELDFQEAGRAACERMERAEREWADLTDYEIVRLYAESPMCDSEMIDFARAVIAAFKEKNK